VEVDSVSARQVAVKKYIVMLSKADWQFTTADARIKLKQLYPTL